jgi:hypothetical protein
VLDPLLAVALVAVQAQAEGDVLEDAHRKWVRLLEHHPDVAAHNHRVDALAVDILAEKLHVADEAEGRDQVVHAVEAAQHGALTAAGRANEARDFPFHDRDVALPHRQELAVVDLVDLGIDRDRRLDRCGARPHR